MGRKVLIRKMKAGLLIFSLLLQVLVPVSVHANQIESTDLLYEQGTEVLNALDTNEEETNDVPLKSSQMEFEGDSDLTDDIVEVVPFLGEDITVYMTFEGYNLGQGFYIEPFELTLPAGSTAEDATRVLLNQKGHGFTARGTGSMFYLERVQNFDTGIVNPPVYITENIRSGSGDGSLGEFDYTFSSGWMITINHQAINVSAGARILHDQDVIRWQFTVQGYGADLGIDSGWGQQLLYLHADKTELIQALFTNELAPILEQEALNVLIDPLATEEEVAAILAAILGSG